METVLVYFGRDYSVADNHGHLYVWDDETTNKMEVHVNLGDKEKVHNKFMVISLWLLVKIIPI